MSAGSQKRKRSSPSSFLRENDDEEEEEEEAGVVGVADFSSDEEEPQLTRHQEKLKKKAKKLAKSNGFETLGLDSRVYRGIRNRGFRIPTPVQRKALPAILSGRDVVAMARTGSGKTAAFLVPMLEKLLAARSQADAASFSAATSAPTHAVSPRALILSPTRELALQTFGVAKGLAKYCEIELCALVGGESFEVQFAAIARRPDAVIATPGRLLHHVEEYKDGFALSRVDFACFDEADRLFEMGFAEQLKDILDKLPPTRQVVLCSATMPQALADFASAGLHSNPHVIRLDAEKRLPPTLTTSFFVCTEDTRTAALLIALRATGVADGAYSDGGTSVNPSNGGDVMDLVQARMDEAADAAAQADRAATEARRAIALEKRRKAKQQAAEGKHRKQKGRSSSSSAAVADNTVAKTCAIFCSTKHHVEYLHLLLAAEGISSVPLHGSMEQTSRRWAVTQVAKRRVAVLLATDVAARGVDLPLLDVVVNYDFPPSPKLYVHRAGRTARAGEPGHCASLVNREDLSYALDLHLFLGKALKISPMAPDDACRRMLASPEPTSLVAWQQAGNATLGRFPTWMLDDSVERVAGYGDGASGSSSDSLAISQLRGVVARALRLYQKTRPKASRESVRRAKVLAIAAAGAEGGAARVATAEEDEFNAMPTCIGLHPLALRLLPPEDVGKDGGIVDLSHEAATAEPVTTSQASLLQALRTFKPKVCGMEMIGHRLGGRTQEGAGQGAGQPSSGDGPTETMKADAASRRGVVGGGRASFADNSFFIPGAGMRGSEPSEFEKQHGVGSSAELASAVMDLQMDDGDSQAKQSRQWHWDAKKRRYIKIKDGETIQHRGEKKVRVESGAKLPGKSLKSGEIFAKWKKRTGGGSGGGGGGRRVNHAEDDPHSRGRVKDELKTPAAVRKEREKKQRMGVNRKQNGKFSKKR
ncbi:ATP-dependent RNA helicase DDX54/DBP10 [Pseudoscourfieldia marina]